MCSICEMCCSVGFYRALKANFKIVKTILSRCLYALYLIVAAWRVVVAYDDLNFWYLLIFMLPLLIETLLMAFWRKGNEYKWISAVVMVYLIGAIPCIWLWELKIFELKENGSKNTTCVVDGFVNICLSQEAWTLALEQAILFILILGKWIAPKGQMSPDELSQLLLVYLGAGADIVEILDLIRDDDVEKILNNTLLLIILAAWSWSLLQFCFVTTAVKDMPTISSAIVDLKDEENVINEVEENKLDETEIAEKRAEIPGISEVKVDMNEGEYSMTQDYVSSDRRSACCVPCFYDNKIFCFHNEIWGMVAGLLFQDVPFFALRISLMVIYRIVTHSTIFFAIKNAFVIILLTNRIRVVVVENKYKWWRVMREARHQRMQRMEGIVTPNLYVGDKRRETFTYETKKPKWLIWRS